MARLTRGSQPGRRRVKGQRFTKGNQPKRPPGRPKNATNLLTREIREAIVVIRQLPKRTRNIVVPARRCFPS
jgi:hypothetical protein